MPLSDEEARLLHQLEQSLAADDPDFASTLRGSKIEARRRRLAVLAALGFVAGLVMLVLGAVLALTIVGVLGFVAMLGGAYGFIRCYRRGLSSSGGTSAPSAPKSPGSFVDRMEERWNRRQDGDEY